MRFIFLFAFLFFCKQSMAMEDNENVDSYNDKVTAIISSLRDLSHNSQTAKSVLKMLNNLQVELKQNFGDNANKSSNIRKITSSCKNYAKQIKQICDNVVKQNAKEIRSFSLQEIKDMFSNI